MTPTLVHGLILLGVALLIAVLAWDNRHYGHIWRDDHDENGRRHRRRRR